jgi:lysyl-tRNA synthetase class 2
MSVTSTAALERGRRPGTPAANRPARRGRVPVVAAVLCLVTGVSDVVDALTPGMHARLHVLSDVVPGGASRAAAAATVVTGLLLVLLSSGLRRRKRRAFLVVAALLAVSVVLHVVKGLDVEEATAAAVELALLVRYRREFTALGDPRTRWRALRVFLGLLAADLLTGVVALRLPWVPLARPAGLGSDCLHVLAGLVGAGGPVAFTASPMGAHAADLFADTFAALGLLTALLPMYLALRPSCPSATLDVVEEGRLRALLQADGGADSLGYFALRRDKAVVWAPSGNAAVAYRVVNGVMLASGDPVGEPGSWPDAIASFLAIAQEHAWTPAVMGCSETGGLAWTRAGLAALELGDEAVVDVADFTLEGRAMRNVRQMVNRVARQGYSCQIRRICDVPAAELAEAVDRAASWRGTGTERGFSMALGRLADRSDGDCVLVTAHRDGQLSALLHFVPWGGDGLSLDLMRRDRSADPGLNELLIVEALKASPGLGVTRMSLNFAVFRAALERGERLGAGPVTRAWRAALVFVSRWYQIDSLYRFNAKFAPRWVPRFVCYPSASDLPRVALAGLQAESFLVWPVLRLPVVRLPGRRHARTTAGTPE